MKSQYYEEQCTGKRRTRDRGEQDCGLAEQYTGGTGGHSTGGGVWGGSGGHTGDSQWHKSSYFMPLQ